MSIKSNLSAVLNNILDYIEEADEDDVEVLASELDCMLDEMSSNDFFGTEQQLDPRGDFRNGIWSILEEVEA